MAERGLNSENANAYKMRLTLLAPSGRGNSLDRIVSSLTDWVDPSKQIVEVDEMLPEQDGKVSKPPPAVDGCLVTPAISVMLFMRETGSMCVYDADKILKTPPWTFHHKVELQNKHAPKTSLAKQEFYKLTDDLPLFAACPVLSENEHFRINLYVKNFPAMVEFYRIITDTEIETNKPDFCIFEIYRQVGLDIQLSLKRSPYIYPKPVESAYISFNVKNIKMVTFGDTGSVDHVGGNVYTVRDPDGNLVVLYETAVNLTNDCHSFACTCNRCQHCLVPPMTSCDLGSFDDVKSFKSTTESQDSGRYSDAEGPRADNTFIQVGENVAKSTSVPRERNISVKSEGYASSSSSTVGDDSSSAKQKTKSKDTLESQNGKKPTTKRNQKEFRTPREVKRGNVTPVYI